MQKELRLTDKQQFSLVMSKGNRWAHSLAILRALPSGLRGTRFGLVVSKRVGKSAVERNKVRRRMREVLRRAPVTPGWDVVVIARGPARTATYQQVEAGILGLLAQARLLRDDGMQRKVSP